MYFNGAYRFIGKVDPEPLARAVRSLGEDAWFEYVERQKTYQPHRRTQTIPLLFDQDGRHTGPTEWPRWGQLMPIFEPVLEKIREANPGPSEAGGDGYFIRIILARLSPHGWISSHCDEGATLSKSHRNHLAIITNQGVEFEVAEEVRHLPAGEIWEINNREEHAVRNTSDDARIHMILDYVLPGERIEDPEGLCIA
jgi:hypothetical protein